MVDQIITTDESFWAKWIAAAGSDPAAWLQSAGRLKRAADILAPVYQAEMQLAFQMYGITGEPDVPEAQLELAPVYLMLAGYALENLAKGLIAARERVLPPAQHLSEGLMKRAGVDLESGEPALVSRLGLYLTALGRYPVPRINDASKLIHTGPMTNPMRYSTNDPNEINPLYDRMWEALDQRIAAASNSLQ